MASMALVGLLALAVVVLFALVYAYGGGKGSGLIAAVLALVVLGGAGVFFFGLRGPAVQTTTRVAVAPTVKVLSGRPLGVVQVAVATRSVAGRVLLGSEGEVPCGDAVVEELRDRSGAGMPDAIELTKCGADGRFALQGLPDGDLRLRAVRKGYAGAAVKVAANSTDEVVLRLVKGARAAGKVVDRETETPVAGALVSWGDSVYTHTDPEGAFALDPVEADMTSIHVRATGFARHTERVKVPEEGRDDLLLRLRPAAVVSGTVFGPDGAPFAGAKVDVEGVLDLPFAKGMGVPAGFEDVVSGPDGKYVLQDAPAGRTLRLSARSEDAISKSVEVEPIGKGESKAGVDLKLEPAGVFLATVLDDRGAPVAGAAVHVTPADRAETMSAGFMSATVRFDEKDRKTDERGFVRVGPVAPGPVKVRANKEDYRAAEAGALSTAGVETPIALTMPAGVAVIGKVVDDAGAPVPGATVTASRFGQGEFVREQRTARDDGTFRVGGLSGRPFMVRAEKKGFVPTSVNNVEPATETVITLRPGGTIAGTVADAAGAPVRKFRILLKKQGDAAANPRDWERFSESMAGSPFEDPAGKFRLEGLEPGTYEVEARAADLAPGRAAGVAVQAASEAKVALTLAAGLELSGIVVRKADGAPVAGARVKIPAEGFFGEFDMGDPADMGLDQMEDAGGEEVDRARETMGAFAKASTVSAADGRFTFRGLETGTVRLMVSAKSQAPATIRGIEVPAKAEVRIELGEESGIEGIVTDAQGAPKPGMTIMLQRIPVFMRFGTTDDQGHYRIGGVGAGSYLFYVMDPASGGGGGLNLKSESVLLEEGKTTRKDHKMGEGTKVLGRVTRGGKAVPGLAVMLFPAARTGGPMGMLTGGGGSGFCMGTTKEDGAYEITGVSPGRYTVSIQGGMGGAPSGGDAIDVARGAAEVRHDVALPEFGIKGIVVDEQGKPVVGAAVSAVEVGRDLTKLSDLGSAIESMGGQDFTDDEGRFTIENMKAVPYKLQVQCEGYESGGVDGVTAAEGAPDVRIALRRGLEVTVKVIGPEGTPVRGASVFLADSEGRELSNLRGFDTIRTGEDGRCTVRAPAGNLRFEAVAPGFAPGETAATIPGGGEVVVKLPKGATVRVLVKDAGGQPVAGAGVEVVGADGKPYAQRISMDAVADLMGGASTGADGVWIRKDLPAGPWKVRAAVPDGRSGEESVTLVEGETAQANVTLR